MGGLKPPIRDLVLCRHRHALDVLVIGLHRFATLARLFRGPESRATIAPDSGFEDSF